MPEKSAQLQKSINWKKVLVVVLLGAALIAAVVGVYYFLYGFQPVTTTNNQIEIKSATPSAKPAIPSANTNKGELTYTYKAPPPVPAPGASLVGFSFKYPSNLAVTSIEDINPDHVSNVPILVVSQNKLASLNEISKLESCVSVSQSAYSNDLQKAIDGISFDELNSNGTAPKVNSTTNITIGGLPGIKRSIVLPGKTEVTLDAGVLVGKDPKPILYLRSCSSSDASDFLTILNSITF